MANSRKSTRKSGNVTQLPGPSSAAGVAEAPEETEPATEAETTPPIPPRPPKKAAKDQKGPENDPNFFQRLKTIPRDDWGTRVFLYLYVLEPLCNLKQSGGKTYLNRYSEPVQDEHQIMLEYGSGRYRLMLSQNKVSPEASNELARYEFEVLNAQYPPKIPRAAWINDSRNAKWEALLPKETQAGTAASTIVDAMKMVSDIRRDVRDEMEPADEPQQNSTSEMLQTMKAAKDLFAPTAAATTTPAKDPLEIATALFTIMNQTKAENPVIDMYRDELKAAREEMKEMRAAAKQVAEPPEKPKTLMEQLTDFKAIKDLFSSATGNGTETTVRAGRTGVLDVFQTLGTKFFESDLASGVGQWLGAMAQRSVAGNGPPQQMNGNPGNQVQQQTETQSFDQFVTLVLNPALLRQYSQGFSGADFAGWLYDAFPDRLKQLQTFTHPMAPGLKGAPVIIGAYKRTPHIWNPIVAQREGEPSFVQFVNEFCQWKPEDSEHDGVIDAEVVHEGEPDEERIS